MCSKIFVRIHPVLIMLWVKMCKSPMGPIAHVPHCPCGPYPAHTPCTPYPCTHCGLLPMCSIPPVPHTPCGPYWPCGPLPLWVSLPMCPILLYPIAPCVLVAHRPHCPCDAYPLYPIALIIHVADCPMGDRSDGHMGNGAIAQKGYGVQGV